MNNDESLGIVGRCVVCLVGLAVIAMVMLVEAYAVFYAEQFVGLVLKKWPLETRIVAQGALALGLFLAYRKLYWLEYQNNLKKKRSA